MDEKLKEWIDQADYEALLRRWRFAPAGNTIFQGEIGDYYAKAMWEKKSQLSIARQVEISKKIGWR